MLKRDLMKLVSSMVVGGAALLVVLPACGESSPAQSVSANRETAAAPAPTAAPPRTPAATLAPTPKAGGSVPASLQPPPVSTVATDQPAQGKLIYDKTAGGVGCAFCHGLDGKGNGPAKIPAPDIRYKTEADVRAALQGGVPMMTSLIKLNDDDIAALVAYLRHLEAQP